MSSALRIGIIIGSTRPTRVGDQVGRWVLELAKARHDATFELVDLADFHLPVLDEPQIAATGQYEHEHTKKWSQAIAGFDGYLFVTPEYNHGVPGGLKNAFDFLYQEWTNKAIGFVSYGADGGVRAVEAWRLIVANAQMADVRAQVSLRRFEEFPDGTFTPSERRAGELQTVLDQVLAWAGALKPLRG